MILLFCLIRVEVNQGERDPRTENLSITYRTSQTLPDALSFHCALATLPAGRTLTA